MRTLSTTHWLAIAAGTFALLCSGAGLNAAAQFGARTRNGFYTCSYIGAKIERGQAIGSPKLVIASGSNAIDGIDIAGLAKRLSIRGLNFGLSASFGPGFQTFEAAKILHSGDAILMPFEYMAYDYARPRDSLMDAVYSCGGDYWQSLDWHERLFFVMAAKPWRLFDAAAFERRPDDIKKTAAQARADAGLYGERLSDPLPTLLSGTSGKHEPLAIRFDPDSPGVHAISAFVHGAQARGVRVFATWPNTLFFREYAANRAFAKIRAFYGGLGVDVIGTPEDAMFPESLMGDTIYHLNRAGIGLRTARLARSLSEDSGFKAWLAQSRIGAAAVSQADQ
jgi:hypothetical protein